MIVTTTNSLVLIRTNDGACLARIDGRVWPNRLNLAALKATVGHSGLYRLWPDPLPVIVDQVGNEVRWKVWTGQSWQELWFLRDPYEHQVRNGELSVP